MVEKRTSFKTNEVESILKERERERERKRERQTEERERESERGFQMALYCCVGADSEQRRRRCTSFNFM